MRRGRRGGRGAGGERGLVVHLQPPVEGRSVPGLAGVGLVPEEGEEEEEEGAKEELEDEEEEGEEVEEEDLALPWLPLGYILMVG